MVTVLSKQKQRAARGKGPASNTNKTQLLNPLEFPIALAHPRRLTDVASWHEHIPFAFALVAMGRPRVIVELGTHKGDSYCAFCQAVDVLGLSTKCYAVDTWEGDPQSGFYGPEVLTELRSYHDSLYGRFSRLIPSTCDEAVKHFPEQSIDLLHIDAFHTYEAVKHDFETWLPKLSDKGIVLLHDTNVREGDFGVWKLWRELQASHPSFELVHGHGLGVLGLGKALSPDIKKLFTLDEDAQQHVRAFFASLGDRSAKAQQLQRLERTASDLEGTISDLKGTVASQKKHTDNLEAVAEQLDGIIADQAAQIRNRDVHISFLTDFERKVKGTLLYKVYRLLMLHKIYNRK